MKKTILTILFSCALAVTTHAEAKTYDFNKSVGVYSSANDAGWDFSDAADQGARLTGRSKALPSAPVYFSVNVPDGNYRVTLVLGSKKRAAETWVRAESRRLMLQGEKTKKGELRTVSFVVNKRNTVIDDKLKVRIKPGEVGSLTWDDKLTLEFCGAAPAVQSVTIEPDTTAVTLFLCGNSTVVDQGREPWASWGQMFPRWFTDKVCVANYGESGLTATSFLAQLRLDKILSEIKKGDYVFCEDCEKRFSTIESYYAEILDGKKSYPPEIPYLFWMSVMWRMSVGDMGCKMDRDHEEKLRKVLDKCLAIKREDIVSLTSTPQQRLSSRLWARMAAATSWYIILQALSLGRRKPLLTIPTSILSVRMSCQNSSSWG